MTVSFIISERLKALTATLDACQVEAAQLAVRLSVDLGDSERVKNLVQAAEDTRSAARRVAVCLGEEHAKGREER